VTAMAENFRKVLVNKGLEITFVIEDGIARLEFRGNDEFDLSNAEDVVVFINGQFVPVEVQDRLHAVATIGDWGRFDGQVVQLMTRVGEFFDGWELDP